MAHVSSLLTTTITLWITQYTCGAWAGHHSASIHTSYMNFHFIRNVDTFPPRFPRRTLLSRSRYDDSQEYYDDDDEDDAEDEDYNRRSSRRNAKRSNTTPRDDLSTVSDDQGGLDIPSPFGRKSGLRLPESVSKAVLAGVFVLGIGTGVTVDSQINTNPKDLASRDAIDIAAPNPRLCTTFGASAIALDQRVFVSFNPFNVYVAQADVKPACVLRPANVVSVLQNRGLVKEREIQACKANMNTWAFVGDLEDFPQLSCVYQSEDAQNEFLSNPKLGIGEDVYDDDLQRATVDAVLKKTGKMIKANNDPSIMEKQSHGIISQ